MGKEVTRWELVRDYEEPTPLITPVDAQESVHMVVQDVRKRALAIQPLGTLVYRLDDARFEQYWPGERDPLRRFSLQDVLLCERPATADHIAVVLFALSVRRGMMELYDDGIEEGYRVPSTLVPNLLRQANLKSVDHPSIASVHPAAALFAQRFLKRMPRSSEDVRQYKAILEANAHGA